MPANAGAALAPRVTLVRLPSAAGGHATLDGETSAEMRRMLSARDEQLAQKLARKLVRYLPGGLALATVLAKSVVFGVLVALTPEELAHDHIAVLGNPSGYSEEVCANVALGFLRSMSPAAFARVALERPDIMENILRYLPRAQL